MIVNGVSPKKKNSLIEKAKRDTSIAKLNYATAPRFSMARPTRPGGFKNVHSVPKVRREPVPANDKNVFGKPTESPKVRVLSFMLMARNSETQYGTHSLTRLTRIEAVRKF